MIHPPTKPMSEARRRQPQARCSVRLGTFCSGIGAPELAATRLGWTPAFCSEIEPFPCSVLAHRFPHTPNLGDMTRITKDQLDEHGPVDVLFAGTPCQSFSVAGLRKGMDDPRGNLALVFLRLVDWARPAWVVWENVPGVLSSNGGRDFGSFLGALGELGYGWAYRVLDAQYVRVDGHPYAVPQRRRRVFVVGHLGDWRRAAAVLFERESLSGHPAPRREAGAGVAATLTRGADSSGKGGYAGRRQEDDYNIVASGVSRWPADVSPTLNAAFGDKQGLEDQHALNGAGMFVAHSLRAQPQLSHREDQDTLIPVSTPIIPIDMRQASRGEKMTNNRREGSSGGAPGRGIGYDGDPAPSLSVSHTPAVAFGWQNSSHQGDSVCEQHAPTLDKSKTPAVAQAMTVRRLTPTECERLQGFPDGWTAITHKGKPAADGPRYKALGNSIAVNVASWILQRLEMVEQLDTEAA